MLESYIQNNAAGMTKQHYFEMCEMLGSEPIDSEIPVELEDFPVEMQEVMEIYSLLQDNWDTMSGNYLGKNLGSLSEIFKISAVDFQDYKHYLILVKLIDTVRSNEINKQKSTD